ncbi:rhomboid family intramembrane serine protease [Sagittula salina]|uniref:Rhomboid family intramembrane serine protease n=1 Tax=Sagittula salina TaxID=2820268 RepID=A0A940MQ63_9RHOB|nr:rhomboid family intramembrane serine protease [Sagittula salina]MBP0483810.1 rhomboid family intramembrane serine protease [Sagittula salina]
MSDPNDPRKHPMNEAPVHPVPPVVVAMFLVLLGIEAVFTLGEMGMVGGPEGIGLRATYIERFGFSGQVFDWMMATGTWPLHHLLRVFSYSFLHGSFYQAIFGMVFILAMGKAVVEAMGALPFVAIYFASAAVGAVAFGVLSDGPWLIGAYPAAYGLIGGFSYLLWLQLGAVGAPQMRAFSLIGVLLAIQLLFGLMFGSDDSWIAELAGFVTGFLLSVVLIPGGWARLLARLRGAR